MSYPENIVSIFCPYKSIYVDKDRPPWYSREIIELALSWEHKLRIYKKTKDNDLFDEAKNLRNQLKTDIVTAKTAYLKHLLRNNSSDAKKFREG